MLVSYSMSQCPTACLEQVINQSQPGFKIYQVKNPKTGKIKRKLVSVTGTHTMDMIKTKGGKMCQTCHDDCSKCMNLIFYKKMSKKLHDRKEFEKALSGIVKEHKQRKMVATER